MATKSINVFISVPMGGRLNRDIESDIANATKWLKNEFGLRDMDPNIIRCNGVTLDPVEDYEHIHADELRYLGDAIQKLARCDTCYFCQDWEKSRGCRVERLACELYGINIIDPN